MEIAGSHALRLPYDSPCQNIHGHNWIVTVYCSANELSDYGMVVDFALLKKEIHGKLDHGNLNEIVTFNPTAENLAEHIAQLATECCEQSGSDGYCYQVDIQESEGNIASYYAERWEWEKCKNIK